MYCWIPVWDYVTCIACYGHQPLYTYTDLCFYVFPEGAVIQWEEPQLPPSQPTEQSRPVQHTTNMSSAVLHHREKHPAGSTEGSQSLMTRHLAAVSCGDTYQQPTTQKENVASSTFSPLIKEDHKFEGMGRGKLNDGCCFYCHSPYHWKNNCSILHEKKGGHPRQRQKDMNLTDKKLIEARQSLTKTVNKMTEMCQRQKDMDLKDMKMLEAQQSLTKAVEKMTEMCQSVLQLSQPMVNEGQVKGRGRRNEGCCFYCHSPDHWKNHCPILKKKTERRRQPTRTLTMHRAPTSHIMETTAKTDQEGRRGSEPVWQRLQTDSNKVVWKRTLSILQTHNDCEQDRFRPLVFYN